MIWGVGGGGLGKIAKIKFTAYPAGERIEPPVAQEKINRLAVYSYLTRYAHGHAEFGRLCTENLPEKSREPIAWQQEVSDKTHMDGGTICIS